MKNIMIIVLLLTVSAAMADSLTIRTDLKEDKKPGMMVSLVPDEVYIPEVFVFGATSPKPTYEVGRLTPVAPTLVVGGYLSWASASDKLYVEPMAVGWTNFGDCRLWSKLGGYIPLNGGSLSQFGELTATWAIADELSFGPAVDWWVSEGSKPRFGLGAIATLKTDFATVSVRGLVRPHSEELRIEAKFPLF